ncbi:hypothetical protein HanXRQr2_Chr04g0187421 [Helianthus annuus]|uniref:Uncharacterized protein n=1 Tax=Helianthus annuus TaxID=4232 RepID=A0A9K3JBN9_HELAN|nr:hypothetical protein HanXRQr2_Chr04g0187421 [Helianthus annuus]KAJ0933086.1 hypothetical protein HanPSC8_Chr04g0181011 [Helianthus annuus]
MILNSHQKFPICSLMNQQQTMVSGKPLVSLQIHPYLFVDRHSILKKCEQIKS